MVASGHTNGTHGTLNGGTHAERQLAATHTIISFQGMLNKKQPESETTQNSRQLANAKSEITAAASVSE
jgi:hypothetical protein